MDALTAVGRVIVLLADLHLAQVVVVTDGRIGDVLLLLLLILFAHWRLP